MTPTLSMPPNFDALEWPNTPRAPRGYKGTKFDFGLVMKLIEITSDDTLRILGVDIYPAHLQATPIAAEPNYPLYFEVTGPCRAFTISIWADRVEIDVCRVGTFKVLSTMFPSTEAELRIALQTVVDACR